MLKEHALDLTVNNWNSTFLLPEFTPKQEVDNEDNVN